MLSGIRVIELGSFITAPLAAMMLGDLGADVIKVERPEGDPFRKSHGGQYGATFLAFNRNKRGVVLDTAKPADRERLIELVATADVLIDNYRPGVLAKIGLEPKALGQRYPRLIHCSVTGFGDSGPYRTRPAFDHVGQALSGITSLLVDPARPEAFGPTLSDNVTAMYAAYAVLGALVERQGTGKGRRLEVNMLEASMAFIQDIYMGLTRTGQVSGKYSRITRSQAFVLTCADGKMLAIHLSTTEKFWGELIAALGSADIGADPRFATHQARVKHYHELAAELQTRFTARSRGDWMALLDSTDVPFSPVNTVADALADPQVEALGTIARMVHPSEGEVKGIACPVLADGARPLGALRAPPLIGEHTTEILAELDSKMQKQR
jgi:crotonobetainyl-CoA:carnitine CoA-transferase CaiB-like acyl-CoA transferase